MSILVRCHKKTIVWSLVGKNKNCSIQTLQPGSVTMLIVFINFSFVPSMSNIEMIHQLANAIKLSQMSTLQIVRVQFD